MPDFTTALGTPRAESWDDAWLAFVGETEERLARRICGAHAPDGEPCELGSTHVNGRCRFHGGHPRIGGQPGNTNALIHGLYSRRLRQCNNTCPVWHMCPFAGPDVTTLSERKRPICAYEREAYAIAMGIPDMEWGAAMYQGNADPHLSPESSIPSINLTAPEHKNPNASHVAADALDHFTAVHPNGGESTRENILYQLRYRALPFFGTRDTTTKFPRGEASGDNLSLESSDPSIPSLPSSSGPHPDPTPAMVGDTSAILYAMLQRATLTLSAQSLTEKTEAEGERYTFRSTKMSPALAAFLRIGRELRAWLRLRPAPAKSAAETEGDAGPGFPDGKDRPEFNDKGYRQFYDHEGRIIGLPELMHPFLHELDAAVTLLRKEGVKIPPPERKTYRD